MRTITHTAVGPAAFDLDVPAAAVTVHCEDRDTAVVTLEAADPQDREALRLIEHTTATSDAERFTVRVPGPKSAGHPIVVDGDPIIVSGTGGVIVTGSVADVTIVNGRLISVAGVTVSGDIAVHAVETSQVRAESVSGDIDITASPGVDVDADTHTVSGRSRNRRR